MIYYPPETPLENSHRSGIEQQTDDGDKQGIKQRAEIEWLEMFNEARNYGPRVGRNGSQLAVNRN